jgi:hypothetical protein
MWSKGGAECVANTVVQVDMKDLQEMHNHMRETMEVGMARLNARAPPGANGTPAQAAFMPQAPAHDTHAESEIKGALELSGPAEQEVRSVPAV